MLPKCQAPQQLGHGICGVLPQSPQSDAQQYIKRRHQHTVIILSQDSHHFAQTIACGSRQCKLKLSQFAISQFQIFQFTVLQLILLFYLPHLYSCCKWLPPADRHIVTSNKNVHYTSKFNLNEPRAMTADSCQLTHVLVFCAYTSLPLCINQLFYY